MVNKLVSEQSAANPRAAPGDNNPPNLVALFTDQLQETYRLEFEKIAPLAARANVLPEKIETDQQQAAVTQVFLDAKQLFDSLDASRKNEKRPMTDAVDNTFRPARTDRLERILISLRERSDNYAREKRKKQLAEQAIENARLAAEAEKARKAAEVAAEFGDTEGVLKHAQEVTTAHISIGQAQSKAPSTADIARVKSDEGGGMSTGREVWGFEIADYSKVDLNALRNFFKPDEIDKAVRKLVKLQKGQTKIDGVRVFEDVSTTFRRS